MMIRWCKLYGQLANIESFTYVFPCDFGEKNNEIDIYGTGGSLLEDLKRVLTNLTGLKQFELKNLELDDVDGTCKLLSYSLRQGLKLNLGKRSEMIIFGSF